jgi:hypothetical protein
LDLSDKESQYFMFSSTSFIFPLNLNCDLLLKKSHKTSALGFIFKWENFSLRWSVKTRIELSFPHPLKTTVRNLGSLLLLTVQSWNHLLEGNLPSLIRADFNSCLHIGILFSVIEFRKD